MRQTTWTDEQFKRAVKDNLTMSGVLRQLGLCPEGGNFRGIHKHVKRLDLDISHWVGRGHMKGKKRKGVCKVALSDVLIEKSPYSQTSFLKKRIIREGLLENICALCGHFPEWHNKPLVLVLDHINGVSDDNRLENLRLLCPNCHSQTDTFTGRNKRKHRFEKKTYLCSVCKKPISKKTKTGKCIGCCKHKGN